MRVITKGREEIVKFWVYSIHKDASYRLVRYHIRTDYEKSTLLLNTATGEMVLLNEYEKELLDHLPMPYNPEMDELIAHHFLVPEEYNDTRTVDQLRRILRKSHQQESISYYSILPTSACNAKCFYCFESNNPRCTMTKETADHVADFIASCCGSTKKISISWFGGEPTIAADRITQISQQLHNKGIQFQSSMYSNGYLFSKKMVAAAKDIWNLKSVQITMDGTEEVYNTIKAYSNASRSPYYQVLDNIGTLLDAGIRVIVRMNVDFHNAEDIKGLIHELAVRFRSNSLFRAYVHELFDGEGYEPVVHTEEEWKTIICYKEALSDCIANEWGEFFKNGENKSLPFLRDAVCMADSPSSVLINPLGQIGKCDHFQFDRLVGTINQNPSEWDAKGVNDWLNPKMAEKCTECALYPHCGKLALCAQIDPCSVRMSDQRTRKTRNMMIKEWATGKQSKKEEF